MTSYANQYQCTIHKKINKKKDVFLMLRWEDYTNAGIDLSKSALNLYMYLAKNIDGYTFFLSSKDYC